MDERQNALVDWIEAQWARPAPVPEILEQAPGLTPLDAYRLQQARMHRATGRGDRIIGYKAALTSKPMQAQAGVDEPVLGTLLASRQRAEGEPVSLAGFLRATLEPEVAVVLQADLAGPGATVLDAMGAAGAYLPCVEIGDIRTLDNPRSLQQTIACNTFNGGHVFGGAPVAPAGLDLRLEGMVLEVNGEVRGSATAVEVLGHPLASVAFMANKLAELGERLRAGMVLMTGSIVKSVPVHPGDTVSVSFTRLGRVGVRFAE